MKKSTFCRDCGCELNPNATRCFCGWKLSEEKKVDDDCHYSIHGQRCKNFGEISPSVGGDAKWYCSEHFKTLDDPQLGEAILMASGKAASMANILKNKIIS